MLNYSRKVIFSIFVIFLFGSASLAYATTADFILTFDGTGTNSLGTAWTSSDGIAVDSNDRILVLDSGGNTVQIYSSAGAFLSTFNGSGTNNLGTAWTNPLAIAVDSNDRILVADNDPTSKTIQVYSSAGAFVFTFDGDDGANEVGGGDGTAFDSVTGIATDSNNRIIAIDNILNLGQIYDSTGAFVANLTGGTTFTSPVGIATDSNNRILVADFDFDLVQVYSSSGAFDFSFTGAGVGGGGTALSELTSVAVDSNDRILVADNAVAEVSVQIYSSAGAFLSTFTGTSGGGTTFSDFEQIATDSNNRILVLDGTEDTVQIYGFPCRLCADFNGDGFDDLAVGVMKENLSGADEGAVNVIYGSANGLHPNLGHTDQFFHQDSLKIEDTAETGDNFAAVLAVGNFNNDGFDDLAIGVPLEDLTGTDREGAVNVIYGSAKGLHKGLGHADQFWTQDSLKIEDTAELLDFFGRLLATGDFNADGFDDLAIGVPFESLIATNQEGAVNVIYGSSKGLHKGLGHGDQFWTQDSLKIEDTAEANDAFGRALAVGDFNNDLFDDLAIGVPRETLSGSDEGAVNVIYGSSKGLHKGLGNIDQFWTQDTFKIEDTAENFDNFGTALAAGDFNDDGFDDLAIGVPFEDVNGNSDGAVNVIYGSSKGLHKGLGLPDQFWHQDSPGIADTAEDFDNFGEVLAVGDFNNDGFDDLAIGVEGENLAGSDEGAVNVIYGSASGLHENLGLLNQFWTQDSTGITDTAETIDKFGHALTVGDFNADGFDDLAIGVPSETLGATDQGAVHIIYGSASGLHRNLGLPDQFWSQDSTNIEDTGEASDCFGLSLPGSPFNSNCSD